MSDGTLIMVLFNSGALGVLFLGQKKGAGVSAFAVYAAVSLMFIGHHLAEGL